MAANQRHPSQGLTRLAAKLITASLITASLTATAAPALAAPEPDSAITAAINQALGPQPASTVVTIGPTNGAAAMAECTSRLNALITGTPPYEQAAITCPAPFWTLYVTLTVMAHTTIATAARPIAAGATLGPDDIALQPEPVSLYAGRQVFYGLTGLAGATALMSLPAGAILTTGNIAAPVIVHAGQTVAVAITTGNIAVSLTATALAQGRVGETINFANPATGKHFAALITASGPVVNLDE